MKYLGKIIHAEFGMIYDAPHLMGLQLDFYFNESEVSTGAEHCVNTSSWCNWKNQEHRRQAIEIKWDYVYKLLKEAKATYVSDLVGRPVEIEMEDNMFKDFRILTEVI